MNFILNLRTSQVLRLKEALGNIQDAVLAYLEMGKDELEGAKAAQEGMPCQSRPIEVDIP